MKTVITILFCTLTLTSFGQLVDGELYHTDPYKINNFLFLNLREFEKPVILKNRIKSISCVCYKLDKTLRAKGKSRPVNYFVKFNSNGNPISYKQSDCKKNCETYEYSFEYDSASNLIHIRELIHWPYSVRYDDIDVFFFYNHENSVTKELVSEKSIYPPRYKYRGTPYENDTSIFTFNINYDTSKIVTSVLKYRSDYKSWTNAKELDTINYFCSFDSIFVSKKTKSSENGIIRDTIGNIIEQVVFRYIHSIPTQDTQWVYKYQYDDKNRVIKTQLYNAAKMLSNTWYFEYTPDGMLYSEKHVARKYRWMKVYHYERY